MSMKPAIKRVFYTDGTDAYVQIENIMGRNPDSVPGAWAAIEKAEEDGKQVDYILCEFQFLFPHMVENPPYLPRELVEWGYSICTGDYKGASPQPRWVGPKQIA